MPAGHVLWFVVDTTTVEPHSASRGFSMHLWHRGRATNTIRSYSTALCGFLNWNDQRGTDWRDIGVESLGRYMVHLRDTPYSMGRYRRAASINHSITALVEFCRYLEGIGLIPDQRSNGLVTMSRYPALALDRDPGEWGANGSIVKKTLKLKEPLRRMHILGETQLKAIIEGCRDARERFLVTLLWATGLRIGEALGLRHSDLHFLADSSALSCRIAGPHLHVLRRYDNVNGAFAKSPVGRHVPIRDDVIEAWLGYQTLLTKRQTPMSDYVFVNLRRDSAGQPMTPEGARKLVARLARDAKVPHTAHSYRHTAASTWMRKGASLSEVQALLGHVSPYSTSVYLHSTDEELRRAIEQARLTEDGEEND